MKRMLTVLAVALVMVAMIVASAAPAMARGAAVYHCDNTFVYTPSDRYNNTNHCTSHG